MAGLLDRLEHVRKYDAMYGTWNDVALSPADTFRRNFWVCAIDDPSAFLQRDVIGIGNILVESDYPHADSTWPNTQERLAAQLAGLSDDEVAPRHVAERVGALPSPGARRGAARPECLLSVTTVDTPVGPVLGTRRDGVRCASAACRTRAPTRWGVPEPSSWTEPLDATRPGAAAPQTVGGLDLVPGMIPTAQSEAAASPPRSARPSLDGSRPGARLGARRRATGSAPRRSRSTTAPHLAAHDVVVVGLNYRLGALGWLAAPGVPSNLGLRDLARRGASGCAPTSAAFGGDPDRIVLMGESAGSGCVAHLLADR